MFFSLRISARPSTADIIGLLPSRRLVSKQRRRIKGRDYEGNIILFANLILQLAHLHEENRKALIAANLQAQN